MTLPTFIVIGPGKTGTTWLYQCLEEHPDIRLARNTKETVFFNDYYDRGLAWYERFFRGYEGARAIGEISNNYFFSKDAPSRIASDIPDVKLISVLRNPIDRLFSAYHYFVKWQADDGIEKAIEQQPTMVTNNFYDVFLERWLSNFPRDRILILLYDDIKTAPSDTLKKIYEFIGVDSGFRPTTMTERVLPQTNPRNPKLFMALKKMARWLRDNNLHAILTWAKLSPFVSRILTKKVNLSDRSPFPPETQKRLQTLYRPHIQRLEDMIGRDLSMWK